mgnify:CR=1 FL=1
MLSEFESGQAVHKRHVCNHASKEIVEDIEHPVVCDAADDNIFSCVDPAVLIIKRRAFDLFHSAAVVGNEHCPVKVGFNFNCVKTFYIDGNNIEFGLFKIADQRQRLTRVGAHIKALTEITHFSTHRSDLADNTGL